MPLGIHLTLDVKVLNLGKLRLERRLLFFRHCAHAQNADMCMAQSVNVGRDIQLASELIVVQD